MEKDLLEESKSVDEAVEVTMSASASKNVSNPQHLGPDMTATENVDAQAAETQHVLPDTVSSQLNTENPLNAQQSVMAETSTAPAHLNDPSRALSSTRGDSGDTSTSQSPGAQVAATFLQHYLETIASAQQQSTNKHESNNTNPTIWQHQSQAFAAPWAPPPPIAYMQRHMHPQPPSTVSLGSSSIPSAVTMTNNMHMHKRKADGHVLQFSDSASKSLKLDHSRSIMSSSSITSLGDMAPPKQKTDAEIEAMTPTERRRYERNLREQQRSYRISQQIKTLRDVLTESGIPYKPNKFSILVSVSDYIKTLQQRSVVLDAEHNKLSDTIQRTIELVSSGQVPSSDDEKEGLAMGANEQDILLAEQLNYKSVFQFCPFASGVASLDGRILYANKSLSQCFDASCSEMEQQSLFLYIRNHQEVFEAMADMLRRSSIASETGQESASIQQDLLFWCGNVTSHRNELLQLNITLSCTDEGNPKYFCFSTAPIA